MDQVRLVGHCVRPRLGLCIDLGHARRGKKILYGWFCEQEANLKLSPTTVFLKGVTKSWKSASVLVELVMIPILAVAFIAWEIYLDDRAMLPMKLFKRSLVSYALVLPVVRPISPT